MQSSLAHLFSGIQSAVLPSVTDLAITQRLRPPAPPPQQQQKEMLPSRWGSLHICIQSEIGCPVVNHDGGEKKKKERSQAARMIKKGLWWVSTSHWLCLADSTVNRLKGTFTGKREMEIMAGKSVGSCPWVIHALSLTEVNQDLNPTLNYSCKIMGYLLPEGLIWCYKHYYSPL